MIGPRLKQLRNRKNLTLSELAKLIGTTPMTLSRYENNQREPDNEMLKKLADFFEVSIDFLLDRTNLPNYKEFNSSTLQIPVYESYGTSKESIPVSSFEIATSVYDFVLNPEELIGFRIKDSKYIPYFLPGDLLIIELTKEIITYSQFYLVVMNDINYVLELIQDFNNQHVFTYPILEPRVQVKNATIVGRVINLFRAL